MVLGEVLAIRRETWFAMREVLDRHARGLPIDREAAAAGAGLAARPPATSPRGVVAVIPLVGLLTHRGGGLLSVLFGGTALVGFTAAVRQAAADPDVESLVILVDSPGGEVDGVQEAADAVFAARSIKRVVAVADTMAASAACWIASQAGEFVVTPSAQIGSIGVFAVHTDVSRALEQAGVKKTLISSGRFKTEGNSFEPLDEEARAAIQRQVDEFGRMFVESVARGRGMPVWTVRGGMGEGRVVLARDAVAMRMADRIGTLDQGLAGLVRGSGRASPAARTASSAAAGEEEWIRRRLALAEHGVTVGPRRRRESRENEAARFRLKLATRGL